MTSVRVMFLWFLCASSAITAVARQSLLSQASDLGPVNAASPIEITLWMKMHDQQGLDVLVAAQQSGKAVSCPPNRYSRGTHPARQKVPKSRSAFHLELHEYDLDGRTFRASSRSATLPPALLPLVAAVGGLSDMAPEPQIARAGVKAAGSVRRASEAEHIAPRPLRLSEAPDGLVFSEQCFYPPTSVSFTSADGTVTASYQGNGYGAPITNSAAGTLPPRGYQPSEIHTAYHLTPLYREGLTGAGTTVAIVDPYGSTTIGQDLAAFSQAMGLPPANLTILGTPTESNFSTDPQRDKRRKYYQF